MYKITHLPGYHKRLPSKMYGGYIKLSETKNAYSIFIEAEKNAKKAPVIFWTNGGPGCSSLMGLFEEFGPFRPTKKGKLLYNPFTWTKFANIVFVEQPIGVGFSWSSKKQDLKTNDTLSAKDNLTFTLEFLKEFPEFKKNKIYLMSESYGGHYIPLWANEIVKYNKKNDDNEIHFKGFMIGNPYVNYSAGTKSQVETYWGHQRIPIHLWKSFKKHKCQTKKRWKKTHLYKCQQISNKIEDTVGKHNPYALSYPICVSNQQNSLIKVYSKKNKTRKKTYNPCIENYTKLYLNRDSVKKAIHAKQLRNKWKDCSERVKYKQHDEHHSQVPLINKLLNDKNIKHLDVMIMSGTNDSICGTAETQRWIETLQIKPKITWKQYFVNKEPAGYINFYKADQHKTFTFATVNGAGHEVPLYKPEAAYYLIKKFLDKTLT